MGAVARARGRPRREPGGRAAAEAAHRPVPALDGQHGRGLDALAARAVRLRLHQPATTPTSAPAASRARYDVIVIADERPRTILEGYQEGTVPPRYAGGIGEAGVRALDAFVRGGGTLVCFNASTAFAIDAFHLPVKNVVAGLPRDQFFANGSILEVIPDTSHPVMAGMPDRAAVFVDRSPVFTTLDGFEGAVLTKYAERGIAPDVGLPAGRVAPARLRRRRGRPLRRRARRAARLPPAVARAAVRHLQGDLRLGPLPRRGGREGRRREGILDRRTLNGRASVP